LAQAQGHKIAFSMAEAGVSVLTTGKGRKLPTVWVVEGNIAKIVIMIDIDYDSKTIRIAA
jgi:hypothetical protein